MRIRAIQKHKQKKPRDECIEKTATGGGTNALGYKPSAYTWDTYHPKGKQVYLSLMHLSSIYLQFIWNVFLKGGRCRGIRDT
ncbi:hypothetical protein CSUI_010290 [Cystoisospora suis]|uniref:Uncharacterized protein n=1 Tax=Cystoisospora suis TaxID=483139 RepID=A0A2C6KHD0_9APIC|nr:hypothetical protein CSUI_010290 [Cystoisospora suis]